MLPGLLLYLLLLLLALRYHEKLHTVVSTHLLYVGSNCCKAQGLDESVEDRLNLNNIYIYVHPMIRGTNLGKQHSQHDLSLSPETQYVFMCLFPHGVSLSFSPRNACQHPLIELFEAPIRCLLMTDSVYA